MGPVQVVSQFATWRLPNFDATGLAVKNCSVAKNGLGGLPNLAQDFAAEILLSSFTVAHNAATGAHDLDS